MMSPTRRYAVGLGVGGPLDRLWGCSAADGHLRLDSFCSPPLPIWGSRVMGISSPYRRKRCRHRGRNGAGIRLLFVNRGTGRLDMYSNVPATGRPPGGTGRVAGLRAEPGRQTARTVTLLLLLSPATLAWDVKAPPPMFEVRTAITVAATLEQVWEHVVTFSELAEPREWYFRAGLAYPMRTRIEGLGPGAIRYCEFSAGPTRPVAGGILEMVVRRDHPSYSLAGLESFADAGRARE